MYITWMPVRSFFEIKTMQKWDSWSSESEQKHVRCYDKTNLFTVLPYLSENTLGCCAKYCLK